MNLIHSSDPRDFDNALSNVALSPLQQSIVVGRYLPLIHHLRHRTTRVSIMFHSSRIIITVGSLIVPALLSIQGVNSVNVQIYWTTWVVSLFVTICNALMALFKFDKRYYYLHTILEKLVSEGWQYVELTGRYSGFHTPGQLPTHENQFIYFCHSIEKIRMKQVEEEYYKLSDSQQNNTPATTATQDTKISLIPPTPQQGDLTIIPTEIVEAVRGEIAKGQESVSSPIVGNAGRSAEEGEDNETPKNNAHNRTPESLSVSFDMS